MAAGDVYKVSILAQGQGSTYMNTYAAEQKPASVTVADFATLANALKELVRAQQSQTITYRSWRAVQVRGGDVTPIAAECRRTGGVLFEAAYSGTVIGGNTDAQVLPPQSALVVTLNTGKIGRRFRGRTYHFGMCEIDQQAGAWQSAILTALGTSITSFMAIYGSGGTSPLWTLGVWSERIATGCVPNVGTKGVHNVDLPNLAGAFSAVTGMVARPTVFTQRRRTLGVGT